MRSSAPFWARSCATRPSSALLEERRLERGWIDPRRGGRGVRRERQPEDEGRSAARLGEDVDRAAVGLGELPDDRKAEATPAGGARAPRVDTPEPVEDPLLVLGRDPSSLVRDRKPR